LRPGITGRTNVLHHVEEDDPMPTTSLPDNPNEVYALGVDPGERDRLVRQADELAPESTELLDRTGLGPGGAAVDLGCGPLGVPSGRVVGVDADATHVENARRIAKERDLGPVEVLLGDARATGLPEASFDVVHARTLLVNVPDPEAVLAEMVRLARPGGWVVGLEPHVASAVCYPEVPEFGRLMQVFGAAFARNGADPNIGPRTGELYRAAGLEDVTVDARARAYPPGHSRRTIWVDLARVMRPRALELGLADSAELDALDAALRAHLARPDTVMMPHLSFLAWGRKP
jgi:SAM-dependent methyltransferase